MKLAIYRAIKHVRGWEADLEHATGEGDPVTGKPVVVDVVAMRENAAPIPVEVQGVQGWEVQLSPEDEGRIVGRHEVRSRHLRCSWVTRERPSWALSIPWYQVTPSTADHVDLVTDGVVRWQEYEQRGLGGDYFVVEPFPGADMVRYILRGANWTQNIGWELEWARGGTRHGHVRRASGSVRGKVAEYCERLKSLDPISREWTDHDWRRYALVALDRQRHGEKLTHLERAATYRVPGALIEELTDNTLRFPYDDMKDTRPCIACNDLVVVSVSTDFPLHHRCAWYLALGLGRAVLAG